MFAEYVIDYSSISKWLKKNNIANIEVRYTREYTTGEMLSEHRIFYLAAQLQIIV